MFFGRPGATFGKRPVTLKAASPPTAPIPRIRSREGAGHGSQTLGTGLARRQRAGSFSDLKYRNKSRNSAGVNGCNNPSGIRETVDS